MEPVIPVESVPELSLAGRVAFLAIEQSRANWQGDAFKAQELGDKMIQMVKDNSGYFEGEVVI